jgi:hypothetical protein
VSLCLQDLFCPSAGTGWYRRMPVCRPGLACRPSSNLWSQLQCLRTCPRRRVTEKSLFCTLIVGPAGTGNRTRATCMAGRRAGCSDIHYDYNKDTLKHFDLICKLIIRLSHNFRISELSGLDKDSPGKLRHHVHVKAVTNNTGSSSSWSPALQEPGNYHSLHL